MSKTYSLLTKPLRKSGETDAPAKWSDISYGPGGGVFACLGTRGANSESTVKAMFLRSHQG